MSYYYYWLNIGQIHLEAKPFMQFHTFHMYKNTHLHTHTHTHRLTRPSRKITPFQGQNYCRQRWGCHGYKCYREFSEKKQVSKCMERGDSPVGVVASEVSGLAVYLAESERQLCTTGCGGSWICSAHSEADSTHMGSVCICIKKYDLLMRSQSKGLYQQKGKKCPPTRSTSLYLNPPH